MLLSGRMQVTVGSAPSPSAVDRTLRVSDAGLRTAVVVVVARNAGVDRTSDKAFARLIAPGRRGYGDATVATAVFIIPATYEAFAFAEVGKDIVVAPAFVPQTAPVIEVRFLTPTVDHPVDGA